MDHLSKQPCENFNFKKRILVIGGGWYGCHIAAEIKLTSPESEVVIYERNKDIFSEISGNFGIRLHAGPHYPRSPATRLLCQEGFHEFLERYPDLVNEHSYSDYGHGLIDVTGEQSKVSRNEFAEVCSEFGNSCEFNPEYRNYKCLDFVADLEEPTIALGPRLRQYFRSYLHNLGVTLHCNAEVEFIFKCSTYFEVLIRNHLIKPSFYDHVINATSYTAFLPPPSVTLPKSAEVVYQVCIALQYECIGPNSGKPFSFIVMDGWFPCLMPYDDRSDTKDSVKKYILTHGKWTILGSYKSQKDAKVMLNSLSDYFVKSQIRSYAEADMNRFWPDFNSKFRYIGWKGTVIAKLKTNTEFRSAVTFKYDPTDMIYVFPGKINNIFNAGREVLTLLKLNEGNVITDEKFTYVQDGALDFAGEEIYLKPRVGSRNTCNLQTYQDLTTQTGSQS